MFSRLGTWCHDRRRLVLVLWIAALFVGNGIAGGIGDAYRQDFSLDGFESTDGFTLVESEFADGSGSPQSGQIVFEAEQGVDDPAVRAAMEAMFAEVAEIDDVTARAEPVRAGRRVPDLRRGATRPGTIAYATVNLPEDIDFTRAADIGDEIRDLTPEVDGLRVELGGFLFAEFEQPSAELFGLAFAIVILIVAFGSVLAMGLPVGVALFGIGLGGALVILASHLMEVPDFAPFVGLMIGLGVGIDYALLIVTRYREQLHAGHDVRESIGIAMDTAGRSVVFAGATVVISLLGHAAHGHRLRRRPRHHRVGDRRRHRRSRRSRCCPALLGFAGDNIERTSWRGLVAAGFVAVALVGAGLEGPRADPASASAWPSLTIVARASSSRRCKREVQHRPPKPRRETVAYRWSRVIQHRPWTVGHRRHRRPARPRRPGAQPAARASPTRATSPTTPRPSRPTTSSSTGFGKGSTGPIYLVAARRRRRPGRRARRGQRRGRRRPRGRVGPRARSPTTRPTRPRSAGS